GIGPKKPKRRRRGGYGIQCRFPGKPQRYQTQFGFDRTPALAPTSHARDRTRVPRHSRRRNHLCLDGLLP
ncbi:MAG: hypothetical protein, partial [Olavius algarvensis Gamma 1 endosymbiont]